MRSIDGFDPERLAERFGTPLFVYSAADVRSRLARLRAAFAPLLTGVHYSVKAASNLALLRLLAAESCGFDVVSGGEIERCLRSGVDPARLVFAGAGKTDAELALALRARVGLVDVESTEELRRLEALARARTGAAGARPRFALRLNPDVDAGTHPYVATGRGHDKFGLPFDEALAALRSVDPRALEFRGFHVHIGSQITDPGRMAAAAGVAAARIAQARAAGFEVATLDLGGGFAARYDVEPPPIEEFARAVRPLLAPLRIELLLEPGRYLVAEAGTLLCRVIVVKRAGDRVLAIVDAAMNDLLRPALYGAFHPVEHAGPDPVGRPRARVDVVGPVCESSDFLARDRDLPEPRAGDLLAVGCAGAYGFSMSSQYNSRPRAAEVLIDGDSARLIRRRETVEDLIGPELVDEPPLPRSAPAGRAP